MTSTRGQTSSLAWPDRNLSRCCWTLVLLAATACAGPLSGARPAPWRAEPEAEAGWGALVDGRDTEALSLFERVVARPGDHVLARLGEASLAFERGDHPRALSAYLAVLEGAARQHRGEVQASADSLPTALAAMAAGRVAILLDEFGGSASERGAAEGRLLKLPLAELAWDTRHELALVADDIARRRGDGRLLARVADDAGCVTTFRVARPAGILPHVDLDAEPPRSADRAGREPGRSVTGRGCLVAVPAFEGRAGAQRVFAEVAAPAEGEYDVVLDFRGEARLSVDGGTPLRHGGETEYGPHVSTTRAYLSKGRHTVELRLASFGGSPELTLMMVPARGPSPLARPPSTPQGAPSPSPSPSPSPPLLSPPVDPVGVAVDFAATYVANRQGASRAVWEGGRRLEPLHRFALGLALQATIARDDPSIPGNFTRDRARGLLRAAVTVDPALARARHALAAIALDDERPREAIDEALAASRSAPGWWLPEWTLYAAYRQRGLTWDADRALDSAIAHGAGACSVVESALARAEDRQDVAAEKKWGAELAVCGSDSDQQIERMRRLGDLAGAEAAVRRRSALAPDQDDEKLNLASVLLARGKAAEAVSLLAGTVQSGDSEGQLRLADALLASGARDKARGVIATVLAAHPELPEIVRAARAVSLPLPLDGFRLDGRKVIRDFELSGRHYAAPAVVVLDRTVTRVFASGAEMVLSHEIVRVQSKDAVQKWGEISVPERTEILVLRTHKADGSTREPEEFAGKDTISAADLAIGDYVEKETIETRAPRDAFLMPQLDSVGADGARSQGAAPSTRAVNGFIGDRFYFQSYDAPLDRSEYLLVTSKETADTMHVDRRAGAPAAVQTAPPVDFAAGDRATAAATATTPAGLVVTAFTATAVPQLFAERSSVPAIEHVPSVRVSLGVGWTAWTRFLREQLYGTTRGSPALQRTAAEIRALLPRADATGRAAKLMAWVGQHIEADDDLRDFASFGVARGRGNRLAVVLALARALDLDAQPVLARSRLTADAQAAAPLEEADNFSEPLVRFQVDGQPWYADPRLKHAPLGYLPPGLDGARVLSLQTGQFDVARSRVDDHREVEVAFRLDQAGGGVAEAVETVRGWPALEWAEIVDRFGSDPAKLRQDFEQRWLGVHFPGAVLKDLRIDVLGGHDAGPAGVPPPTRAAVAPVASGGVGEPRNGASLVIASRTPEPGVGVTATAPAAPYAAAEVRLRYAFSSSRLAVKRDRELRFLPTFFRSQPGRRYATEPRRSTSLMTGFDVPLELRARVELPAGGRLLQPARPPIAGGGGPVASTPSNGATAATPIATSGAAVVTGAAGYRFVEERRLDNEGPALPPVLLLRREARLPIMRVPLAEYPALAAELRRVDALEQEEVRIGVGPERP